MLDRLLKYLEPEHRDNLHLEAFADTSRVISDFFDACLAQRGQKPDEREPINWVCSSRPGHGKTTALECLLKLQADETNSNRKIPALIALRDSDHMDHMRKVLEDHKPHGGHVLLVDRHNLKAVESIIGNFQFVIISHQRLRNLAVSASLKYSES